MYDYINICCKNERHRYSVFLKPNWKHLKLQLNQCSSTGFVKIFSNHLKGSRKGLRHLLKILSKTAKPKSQQSGKPGQKKKPGFVCGSCKMKILFES